MAEFFWLGSKVSTRRSRPAQVGLGIFEAFCAGGETVRLEDFDYLCKLDMALDRDIAVVKLATDCQPLGTSQPRAE